MVDRVTIASPETGNAPPAPIADPNRPAHVPEKFWKDGKVDTEGMAKSYTELEAEATRLRQGKALEGTPDPAAPSGEAKPQDDAKPDGGVGDEKNPDGTPKTPPEDAAKKIVESAGLDVAPYQQEYDTTGDVTPENRAKIAEGLKGILGESARSVVDEFIEGRKVVQANDTKLFMDTAGGTDSYAAMTAWAKTNLPPEQVAAYNKTVTSGDRHATLFAIEGLKAKFEAINGRVPNLLKGNQPPGSGGAQPFGSVAEQTRAMQDPKYKTDQAYRDQVKARIARTTAF